MGVFTCSLKHQRLSSRLLFYVHRRLSLSSRLSQKPPSPLHSLSAPLSRSLHFPHFPSNSLLCYNSRFSHVRPVSTHFNPGDAGAADNNDNHLTCSVAAPLADSNAEDDTSDEPSSSPTSHRCPVDKNEDSAYQSLRTRFMVAFQKRVVDWQDIPGSLEPFPYFLSDDTKDILVDCTASHLWQPKYASYGLGLPASSRRICLRGPAGSELYQEKLVEAVAKHLKASLLVLDSTVLSPYDYGDQEFSSESDEEFSDSEAEHVEGWCANDSNTQDASEVQDIENEGSRNREFKVDALLEFAADSVEEYKQKLLLQERKERRDAGQEDDSHDFSFRLRKGDRVKYVGSSDRPGKIEQARQVLKVGQKGRIVSVPKGHTGKVGVQFESSDRRSEESMKTNKKLEEVLRASSLVDWCDLSELEPDESPQSEEVEDWLASVEALCEMSPSAKPLIVYFPDPKQWFERAVPSSQRKEFLERVEAKFDQLEGPIVLIASRINEEEVDYDDKNRLKAHLEGIRARLNLKTPATKWTVEEVIAMDIYELFVNTIKIHAPQDEQQLREWRKRLNYDKELCSAKRNIQKLHKVLELHNMECPELSSIDSFGLNLTDSKAERVVGWARNHHLGLCLFEPLLVDGKLMIPATSVERAITRLREQENRKAANLVDYKALAEDEYEKALLSAVIPPEEVGVKFSDVGALENVKDALRELVMLPLQRPELFVKGNLTKPCKGVLLFGPPGTGKTLLAKAVATEAGANFINITGSTITSKWFGDAEKLTKALFSLARKLSPAVIFVDEVDSLLGARGGSSEHEATRKTRNEFMAAWDGLKSKDSERVLVLAATNRPYDLDDAVIRRLPRRVLVDLPNYENRIKILRVILAHEELAEGFSFEELARITHGYSGSDLKNLSVAAAYRPIREYLEENKQQILGSSESGSTLHSEGVSPPLRALRLDDFQESLKQIGASVAFDASSMNELRQWNDKYGEGGSRKKSNFGFS